MAKVIIEKAKYEDVSFSRNDITEIFNFINEIYGLINANNPHQDNKIRFAEWTVGITDNITERKNAHNNPKVWKDWECSSDKISREAERFFCEFKKSGGHGGGGGNAKYLYCFYNKKA